jgi:hypothetical protein
MAVWLGEWLAKARPPSVDLSRALQGTHTPHQGPGGSPRARYDRRRFPSDVEADHPFFDHASWDQMKQQWGEQGPDGLGTIRPEQL